METKKNSAKSSKLYSANELCNIIKTCNKNGVTNLKISGIEINFTDQGTDFIQPQVESAWPPQKKSLKKEDSTPLKPLDLTDKDLEEIKEIQRAQQAIDDPLGFEEQVIHEFLEGEANEEANGYS